jgi:uncharacterized hydrophobic protein (TIGR00271 family)
VSLLRLEIHAPSELATTAKELLVGARHAMNVSHYPQRCLDPAGDVFTCDVPRESAALLISQLESAGLTQGESSIAVLSGISHLSARADQLERDAPGKAFDAVIWPVVRDSLDEETEQSISYFAFMCLATVIAVIGVVENSAILIVGAMVLGPEFGPIAALSVGLVTRNWQRVGRAWLTTTVGFIAAFLVGVSFAWIAIQTGLFPSEQPLGGFVREISEASILTFIIAVLAGIGGALSVTSARSGALIGVLISITTIPAVGDAAMLATYGNWKQAIGALGTLAVNLTGIACAATATFLVQHAVLRRRSAGE